MSIATYYDVLLPASLALRRSNIKIHLPHLLPTSAATFTRSKHSKQTAMDYSLNQVIDTSHHECSRVKDKPSVRDFFSLSHTYVIIRIRYLCKYKAHEIDIPK